MEQYLWIFWLVIFVLMIIIEAMGPNLVSIWFAVGALVSLILSFIPGVPWWVELIVFVAVSAITLLALRPVFKKYLKKNTYQSNIDSFTGKRGYVIEEITYLTPGTVKIGDVKWNAVPADKDEKISVNAVIEVVAVNGNKLIVKKVED